MSANAGSLLEWKGILIRNLGFLLDMATLLMALGHYLHIWWLHGMAFHLVDAVLFLNIRVIFRWPFYLKHFWGFLILSVLVPSFHIQSAIYNIVILCSKWFSLYYEQALLSAIVKRVKGFIKLRMALGSLHAALPDATSEELRAYDDECAICRVSSNLPFLKKNRNFTWSIRL